MHPILARAGRILAYLAIWILLACLLVLLFVESGHLSWIESAAIVLPLALVYSFVCLSPWYVCRMLPIGSATMQRLVLTHVSAAIFASLLWIVTGKGIAVLVASLPPLGAADPRFSSQLPLLFGVGILLYLLSVALHYVFLALEQSRAAENRAIEARVLAREAELKALRAQVNPHFLFNSLHSISALTSVDAARARDMCVRLSDFLRSTLKLGDRETITLEEELSLARSYLEVEQIRFGARLRIDQAIEDECRDCRVPPLLLQPLVENAIKHGMATLVEGGVIRLEVRRRGRSLRIVIENDFDPESPSPRRNGVGLANVRSRLKARYGEDAEIETSAKDNRYRAALAIPAER